MSCCHSNLQHPHFCQIFPRVAVREILLHPSMPCVSHQHTGLFTPLTSVTSPLLSCVVLACGRLQSASEYLVSPNPDSFTIEVTCPNPGMVIVGARVLLGKNRCAIVGLFLWAACYGLLVACLRAFLVCTAFLMCYPYRRPKKESILWTASADSFAAFAYTCARRVD